MPVTDMFVSTEGLVGHSEPGGAMLTFASDTCLAECVDEDGQPVQGVHQFLIALGGDAFSEQNHRADGVRQDAGGDLVLGELAKFRFGDAVLRELGVEPGAVLTATGIDADKLPELRIGFTNWRKYKK